MDKQEKVVVGKSESETYNQIRVTDFPPELQQIISEIIPSTDPLDAPTFNPIEYINGLFPNGIIPLVLNWQTSEQSLGELDNTISRLKIKIARTDEEIIRSVREQVSAGSKGKRDLEEAKRAIQEVCHFRERSPLLC